jgi:O6-methylguanine-DNA--protein-cysteine methyltransferase
MTAEPISSIFLEEFAKSMSRKIKGQEQLKDEITQGTKDKLKEFFNGLKRNNKQLIKRRLEPLSNEFAENIWNKTIEANKGTIKFYEEKDSVFGYRKKVREVKHK